MLLRNAAMFKVIFSFDLLNKTSIFVKISMITTIQKDDSFSRKN